MSLAEYATRRGVSVQAVYKAVKEGRLLNSLVGEDGETPEILDPELADREWESRTDYTRANQETLATIRKPKMTPEEIEVFGPVLSEDGDEFEAGASKKYWDAQMSKLKFEREIGELVSAKDIESKLVTLISNCKTRLLAIPNRCKQQDPTLTLTQLTRIEDLIREACEDLAGPVE